ncbi:protein suppressor 2 of zeste isoform X2 [Lutzomyia longipalpis]|uniref:protein suppressor 2 of zeste isoform X2 n=1 Tax=Lutzomyia longipalpis TaxID=7200 RepID=UPI0024834FEF|nr:protein suppressor 2 of zeste isoform X2 [Lutzomyia longipalpis]
MPQKASKVTKADMMSTNSIAVTAAHPRRKVRDFNSLITCTVCHGYIIEATTITDCMHTFCRSCILKQLEKTNFCPTCSHKPVTVASLRPDRILKQLIYKLVPGLYQSECQRVAEFHGGTLVGKLSANRRRFSGLMGIPSPEGKASDDDINHNISGKNSDSEYTDDADFFYPEEPISLSMEYHPEVVASLNNQKSTIPPIRYLQCPAAVTVWHLQRFITTKFDLNPSTMIVEIIYEDEVLPRDFSLMDVAYCYNWKRVAPMRFYYRIFMQTPEKSGTTDKNRNYMTVVDEKKKKEVLAEKMSVEKKIEDAKKCAGATSGGVMRTFIATTETKVRDEFEFVDETAVKSESTQYNSIARRAQANVRDNLPNVRIEKMKLEDGVKTVKLTMINTKTEPTNSKPKFKIESTQVTDFKRLRSSDSEFGEIKPPSGIEVKSKNKSATQSSMKPFVKEDGGRQKKGPSHVSKKRAVDDDSPDELSCSKSTNKKCYINRNKKSHGEMENGGIRPPNLPTLKVDLTNLKTKITLPKVDKSPPPVVKSPPPVRLGTEIEETSPNKYEYVKNIGLLPISDVLEAKRAKPEQPVPQLKEKKRKKMKHSKEPNEKRPKIHAEMIPNEKEPIKLKLKFTNNKPIREGGKTPNGTEEFTKITIPVPPKPSSKDNVAEMRKVRHKSHSSVNSALNKTLSTESMAISSLVRRMSVDLPQLPYNVQNTMKTPPQTPLRSPPKTPPQTPPRNQSKSPPAPKITQQQPASTESNKYSAPVTKASTPKAYPGLMSPKATDRGARFNFPLTSPTYNARPASFPPYPMPMPRPMPLPPKTTTATFTSVSSTKPLVSVLKRSSSVDGCSVNVKQPRIEESYPRTQNSSIPPLKRTSSSPVASVSPPKSPANSDKAAPYYTSTMGPAYTHENNVKKPLPILLPPSSISVTKMSDVPPTSAALIGDKRPAVEIVRINSNTPAIDQQQQKVVTTNQKATRPPPATIPLVKIKKSLANTPSLAPKPTTTPTTTSAVSSPQLTVNNNKVPTLHISLNNTKSQVKQDKEVSGPPVCDNIGALDLSGKSSRSPSLEKSPTALSPPTEKTPFVKSSIEKKTSSEAESRDTKATVTNKSCQLPVPKLNEISKIRPPTSTTALMRQQNPSVRSIPNPSALAFRNQVLPLSSESNKSKVEVSKATTVTASTAATAATTANSATTTSAAETSAKEAAQKPNTTLTTKLDPVVSTKTPIVSHKQSGKGDSSEGVSFCVRLTERLKKSKIDPFMQQ